MRLSLIFFITLITLTQGKAHPDSAKPFFSVGLRSHYGFVILHSQDIRPIGQSFPWGVSLDFSWHYNSKKAFDNCLCFPRLGIATTYWDYDNPEILGQGITSVFFIEPFFGGQHKLNFSFRSGFGLAYANNPYDEVNNPTNLSYSTQLSFALMFGANINFRISNRLTMSLSANYNHISNGGMNEPNKGINYPNVGIGMDYYLQKKSIFKSFRRSDWKTTIENKNKFFLWFFATGKQLSDSEELKRYPTIGIDGRCSRQVSRINAINLGFEYMGDGAHKEEIKRCGKNTDHKKGGILFGNEFLLGKFNFSQQFGIYIYNPYKRDADVFQRYALDLQLTKNLFAGFGLKAHGHVADFLDFRIGIRL